MRAQTYVNITTFLAKGKARTRGVSQGRERQPHAVISYDTARRRFAYALFSTSSTAARAATTAVNRAARWGSGAAIAAWCWKPAPKIVSQKDLV